LSASATVVILAFGDEPWLDKAVESVLRSDIDDLEVVVVDNGTKADLAGLAGQDQRIRVVGSGTNRGFTGGVNLGVAEASGEVVVLLNSDAEIIDDSLTLLVDEAAKSDAGIVGALVLLADDQTRVNSWGNPLHVLGLSWAGGFGKEAAMAPPSAAVPSASGACLAMRRDLWEHLGGLSDLYFAYFEDMDLCWRCHQQGLPVRVLSEVRVAHHYEFSRNPQKLYLLERNRLLFMLTVHELRTLVALMIPMVGLELALLVVAAAQGWRSEKVRGWAWLWRERKNVRALRRRVQASRKVRDADLLEMLTDTFDTTQLPIPAWASPLQGGLRLYWKLVRPAIRGGRHQAS
jgi:GT2 family glycosyltransferase